MAVERKVGWRQIGRLTRLARQAIEEAGLTAAQADRLLKDRMNIERFQWRLDRFLGDLKSANPYALERDWPDPLWNYGNEHLPLPYEQARCIQGMPGLNEVEIDLEPALGAAPSAADGFMAVPFLRDLGVNLGIDDPMGRGYGDLVSWTLKRLAETRPLSTDIDQSGEIRYRVRLHADVRQRLEMLERFGRPQKGTLRFHIWPVSMGRVYAGFSPRNARETMLERPDQIPLGTVHVSLLLMAWPQRLERLDQPWIDCAAEESCVDTRWWRGCGNFQFANGSLSFYYGSAGATQDNAGSPVAFVGDPA